MIRARSRTPKKSSYTMSFSAKIKDALELTEKLGVPLLYNSLRIYSQCDDENTDRKIYTACLEMSKLICNKDFLTADIVESVNTAKNTLYQIDPNIEYEDSFGEGVDKNSVFSDDYFARLFMAAIFDQPLSIWELKCIGAKIDSSNVIDLENSVFSEIGFVII